MPTVFTEPDDPALICHREEEYKGDKYHFCSDQFMGIFDNEPEKHIQAFLPPFIITKLTEYVLKLYTSVDYFERHPPIRHRDDLRHYCFVSHIEDLLIARS
ncbi:MULTISPECIES: YHS domain-containing protein [Pseudomonas]|uniref:YHS domain-containing protein n=1 Tax=Pseudomonas TaxID=286 RepID=UPI0012E39B45|nr:MULTISPECIES: YHS domain-containing protein [unclassified Pseudomonas]